MSAATAVVEAVRAATWPQWLIAAGFVTTGVAHFVNPGTFENIVPDALPAKLALVLISGAAEIAGGAGMLVPRYRRLAGIGLIVLLVAIFPANIDMALNPEEHDIPEPLLWARLPLQPLLIWAVYRSSLGPKASTGLRARRTGA